MSLVLSGDSPKVSADSTGVITSGTAQATTSGTAIDFTGIPSWVKRITVMLNGVSVSGTSLKTLRLGTSGGVETSGYVSGAAFGPSAGYLATSTSEFVLNVPNNSTAPDSIHGSVILTNLSGNIWTLQGVVYCPTYTVGNFIAGSKTLTSTLDRIRLTTVNGTDTFDAGSVNILYE